jgi:rhodanese-related sulfurtransferase
MLLLDLRSRTQFENGTMPGAIHYPAERILEEGLPNGKNGRVVLLCDEGLVSSMVADALRSKNDAIYYLEGGLVLS